VRQNEQFQMAPLLQRLKAEQTYREMESQETRRRLAAGVRTIWAERTFLIGLGVVGLSLGLLIAFLIPPRYTSTARLMPPDYHGSAIPQPLMSLKAMGISQIATDLLGSRTSSDILIGVLGSRSIQDKIIQQFDLKSVYRTNRMEDTRSALASHVAVTIDRKSDMISISVTDRQPERAAAIADAYLTELNRLLVDLSTSSARRERIFLEGYLVQVQQDLENAERDFSQFASKNSTIDVGEQGKALLGAAATLQGQLIVAQSELEALRQIYSDSHIRVRTVKARVEELQSQLRKLAGKDQGSTIGPYTEAAELYPSIRKLPVLGVTYADLHRRAKVQEVVYELLTQEYNIAKVQEARDVVTVKVLDPPNIPEKKSFPPRMTIAASSTVLAIAIGLLVVLVSKSWSERDPGDLGKAVAMEIWVDLKEKRFLTPGNVLEKSGFAGDSISGKRRIRSFFGLGNSSPNGNVTFSPSDSLSEKQPPESKLADTLKASAATSNKPA